jgi:hypothetical protein
MIAEVIRWSNDNVMVFDEDGEQIIELQGRYLDVKDKIDKEIERVESMLMPHLPIQYYHGSWREKQLIKWNKNW